MIYKKSLEQLCISFRSHKQHFSMPVKPRPVFLFDAAKNLVKKFEGGSTACGEYIKAARNTVQQAADRGSLIGGMYYVSWTDKLKVPERTKHDRNPLGRGTAFNRDAGWDRGAASELLSRDRLRSDDYLLSEAALGLL
ncbi:hypothetical protein [Hymenobacter jeollabukensis]|uniref:Uncharacterized protein n=1 Tax=Hymenobacter jeollabukensis TaxID=2025313 RepID=A0A5R8WJC9_9BACT|nr:hypothetical protein [Hymenobacter jeollabukensis]TLM88713.1 hypothetical protein FDY95_23035 [Hymenobacter jeollabukensis]